MTARQRRQAAGVAIEFSFFTYSEDEWGKIKGIIRKELGVDADKVTRQVTPVPRHGAHEWSKTGIQPLRDRIENAATVYRPQGAINRQSPRRSELNSLRDDAEGLRRRILDALAIKLVTEYDFDDPALAPDLLRDGVDDGMLTATRDYFAKLKRNLDRRIAQAGSRRGNARKTDRNWFWNQLLAIWCELGGKESGAAPADFLMLASLPVMGSAVPTFTSVMQWLERRRNRPPSRSPSQRC